MSSNDRLSGVIQPSPHRNDHMNVYFWIERWSDCLGYLEGAPRIAAQPEVFRASV